MPGDARQSRASQVTRGTSARASELGLALKHDCATVVSGSSDPLLVEVRHSVLAERCRVLLLVRIINVTKAAVSRLSYVRCCEQHLVCECVAILACVWHNGVLWVCSLKAQLHGPLTFSEAYSGAVVGGTVSVIGAYTAVCTLTSALLAGSSCVWEVSTVVSGIGPCSVSVGYTVEVCSCARA
jgi:hypothetical protein